MIWWEYINYIVIIFYIKILEELQFLYKQNKLFIFFNISIVELRLLPYLYFSVICFYSLFFIFYLFSFLFFGDLIPRYFMLCVVFLQYFLIRRCLPYTRSWRLWDVHEIFYGWCALGDGNPRFWGSGQLETFVVGLHLINSLDRLIQFQYHHGIWERDIYNKISLTK